MTLLAIILGLSIERLMPNLLEYRRFDWLFTYQQWMKNKLSRFSHWNDTLSFALILLLPIIAISFLHYEIYKAGAVLGFAFSVLILAYSLGPRDIYGLKQQLKDLPSEDCDKELRTIASQLSANELPGNSEDLFSMVKNKILLSINTHLLGVLFWFLILGPMGAIMYRLTLVIHESHSEEEESNEEYASTAAMLFAIINLLPAHVTALCFATTGNFVDAAQSWQENKVKNLLSNPQCDNMLTSVGEGAMNLDETTICDAKPVVGAILSMAKRSIILWLTVLALLTMSGWAG
ncbi:MAG: hypothetical protein ACC707_18325 [Thiohalomonadales bacterium]